MKNNFILIFLSSLLLFSCFKKSSLVGGNILLPDDVKIEKQEKSNFYIKEKLSTNDLLILIFSTNNFSFDLSQWLERESSSLKSLYMAHPIPYPGAISDSQSCSKSFWPEEVKQSRSYRKIYFVNSNKYLSYGICSKSEIFYKSILINQVCKQNTFQIKLFSKKLSKEKLIDFANKFFSCK